MFAKAYLLEKRQGGGTFGNGGDGYGDGYDDGDDGYGYSWWFSPAGMAVRYAIVVILFAVVLLYFVGGYMHAHRRVRKGLPPLRYHRWMVQRRYVPQSYSQHQHQANQGYPMETYAPPPPAYNPAEAPPPVYQPPEGGSKVMADQSYVHVQPLPHTAGETSDRTSLAAPSAAARQ